MNNNIKVLLVDDHAVVRAGFKLLLATTPDIEVIAEANCGEEAINLYLSCHPDVVVLDLSMPGIGGLETISRLIQRDKNISILVFSFYDEPVYFNRALNMGAKGYITKSSAPKILSEAIISIHKGQNYIEQGLIKVPYDKLSGDNFRNLIQEFSTREFDIFRLSAQGLSAHKIADELCLSYKTVANYITNIKKKLNVSNVTELAKIAALLGVIKL